MSNERNYNYFDKFVTLVNYSCEASQMLSKTLENFNNKSLEERLNAMHEIEHAADLEKHELINKLSREFITPIEREDIMTITDEIDDLTDFIEDVVMVMYMFNINSLRKEFSNFRKSTTINGLIIAVNRLEEEADKIYVNSVKNLFATSNDPIEIMKWREIFNRAEKCCDSCEIIANSIEGIMMKNS